MPMGIKKRGTFCKKRPFSHPREPARTQSTLSRQSGPCRLLGGKTPCRRSLMGQRHSHPPSPGRSHSGHPGQSQDRWEGETCAARQQQMRSCSQAPTTTYSHAHKCPPSVGRLQMHHICRHRRQGRHQWGCKHPSLMVSPKRRQHDLHMSTTYRPQRGAIESLAMTTAIKEMRHKAARELDMARWNVLAGRRRLRRLQGEVACIWRAHAVWEGNHRGTRLLVRVGSSSGGTPA